MLRLTCPPEPTPPGMLRFWFGVPDQEAGHAWKTIHDRANHPASPRSGSAPFRGQDRRASLKADRYHRADVLTLAQRVRRHPDRPGETSERLGEGKLAAEASARRRGARQGDSSRGGVGKLLSPAKRWQAVDRVRDAFGREYVSERRACRVPGQSRSTQRRQPCVPDDEPRLVRDMVALAEQYGRYGDRRVTKLLKRKGWQVNHKRVERLWRREGLKVPQKQPKRRRLWLNDGSFDAGRR